MVLMNVRSDNRMKKLNNKGFTLVELLAVLVIMIAIASIAIPTINSSLERSKKNQDEKRIKLLESAAELYVSEHKNNFNATCLKLSTLVNGKYVDSEAVKDADGKEFKGVIRVNAAAGDYEYVTNISESSCCCNG